MEGEKLGKLDINGTILLKLNVKKGYIKLWAGLILLTTGNIVKLL
jgi:hypothetical protein